MGMRVSEFIPPRRWCSRTTPAARYPAKTTVPEIPSHGVPRRSPAGMPAGASWTRKVARCSTIPSPAGR